MEYTLAYDYSAFKAPEQESTDLLTQISRTAREQRDAEVAVAKAEKALEDAQAALKIIAEVRLPGLLEAAGQTELTTADGITVKLDEAIRANIPKDRAPEAFAWLRIHKHDGIIKHRFEVDFNKDSAAKAAAFGKTLDKHGFEYNEKRAVHPSTLSAFVREQLEKGVALPMDVFGVFRQKVTKLKIREQ